MAANTTSLAVVGIGLLLILMLTIFSLATAARTSLSSKREYNLTVVYKDKDGTSTKECTNKYSTAVPKWFLGVFSLGGTAIATALVVHSSLRKADVFRIEGCISLAGWVSSRASPEQSVHGIC